MLQSWENILECKNGALLMPIGIVPFLVKLETRTLCKYSSFKTHVYLKYEECQYEAEP